MGRIDRPAVLVDFQRKAQEFFALFSGVMTFVAQALKLALEELLSVAAMGFDVICDRRGPGFSKPFAGLAVRDLFQLARAPVLPGLCEIPFPPGILVPAFFVGAIPGARPGPLRAPVLN